LKDFISKEEFDLNIEEISKKTSIIFTTKRHDDLKKQDKFVMRLAITTFLLLFLFVYFFYVSSMKDGTYLEEIFALTCLVIALGSVTGVAFITFFRKIGIIEPFEKKVAKELGALFQKYNRKYVAKGLCWRVVPGHYWIELRVDQDLHVDMEKVVEFHRGKSNIEKVAPETARSVDIQKTFKKNKA
jgi:hypothetical protein